MKPSCRKEIQEKPNHHQAKKLLYRIPCKASGPWTICSWGWWTRIRNYRVFAERITMNLVSHIGVWTVAVVSASVDSKNTCDLKVHPVSNYLRFLYVLWYIFWYHKVVILRLCLLDQEWAVLTNIQMQRFYRYYRIVTRKVISIFWKPVKGGQRQNQDWLRVWAWK